MFCFSHGDWNILWKIVYSFQEKKNYDFPLLVLVADSKNCLPQELANIFCKGPESNITGFVLYVVSCHNYSILLYTIDSMHENEPGCVFQ